MGPDTLSNHIKRTLWVPVMVLTCVATLSYAQGWKAEKNIEIIVPTGPGGAQDRTARAIQTILQKNRIVEPSVTVLNRPGGGGSIAYGYLNQHAGNGHYMAMSAPTLLTSYITGQSPHGPNDFSPLALLFNEYIGFVVRADSPIKSGKDIIEKLKEDPSALSIALASARANPNHIAVANAMGAAGLDVKKLKVVVYDATPLAISALLGGHVDILAPTAAQMAPHVASGRVRMIAVSSPSRLPGTLSSVPTWREQGIESVFTNWRIVVGPKGLSDRQLDYWDAAFTQLTSSNEWGNELKRNGFENGYTGSREVRKYWDQQYKEIRKVLTDLGVAK